MIAITWQFEVKKGREAEFEELYGVDGEWTADQPPHAILPWQLVSSQDQSRASPLPPRRILERDARLRAAPRLPLGCGHRVSRRSAPPRSSTAAEPLGIFTALNVPDRTGPTWSQRR